MQILPVIAQWLDREAMQGRVTSKDFYRQRLVDD
jgi:hypothetical protein